MRRGSVVGEGVEGEAEFAQLTSLKGGSADGRRGQGGGYLQKAGDSPISMGTRGSTSDGSDEAGITMRARWPGWSSERERKKSRVAGWQTTGTGRGRRVTVTS